MIVQATANFEVSMEEAVAAIEEAAPVAEDQETCKLYLDEVGVALCEAVQKIYDAAETKRRGFTRQIHLYWHRHLYAASWPGRGQRVVPANGGCAR